MGIRVPPNGFLGTGQQTLATQHLTRQWLGNGNSAGSGRRRRKAKAAKPAKRTRRASAGRGKVKRPARMVKGSAAAKRYMAALRRKRK